MSKEYTKFMIHGPYSIAIFDVQTWILEKIYPAYIPACDISRDFGLTFMKLYVEKFY